MAGAGGADVFAARLADPNLGSLTHEGSSLGGEGLTVAIDVKIKLQLASELRDSIDLFTHTVPSAYTDFLQKLMPVFLQILRGPPVFISTSPEQVKSSPRIFGDQSIVRLRLFADSSSRRAETPEYDP
jgi:hypothetical protein